MKTYRFIVGYEGKKKHRKDGVPRCRDYRKPIIEEWTVLGSRNCELKERK